MLPNQQIMTSTTQAESNWTLLSSMTYILLGPGVHYIILDTFHGALCPGVLYIGHNLIIIIPISLLFK